MVERRQKSADIGGISLSGSLAITAVLSAAGIWWFLRQRSRGAPNDPQGVPPPTSDLERIRRFYEADLIGRGCPTDLAGATIPQIYAQYLAAFLECTREFYENDLFQRFGYTGSLRGSTVAEIYESYLAVFNAFTGGG